MFKHLEILVQQCKYKKGRHLNFELWSSTRIICWAIRGEMKLAMIKIWGEGDNSVNIYMFCRNLYYWKIIICSSSLLLWLKSEKREITSITSICFQQTSEKKLWNYSNASLKNHNVEIYYFFQILLGTFSIPKIVKRLTPYLWSLMYEYFGALINFSKMSS